MQTDATMPFSWVVRVQVPRWQWFAGHDSRWATDNAFQVVVAEQKAGVSPHGRIINLEIWISIYHINFSFNPGASNNYQVCPFRMLQQHDKERGCEIKSRNNSLVLKHLPKEMFFILCWVGTMLELCRTMNLLLHWRPKNNPFVNRNISARTAFNHDL